MQESIKEFVSVKECISEGEGRERERERERERDDVCQPV